MSRMWHKLTFCLTLRATSTAGVLPMREARSTEAMSTARHRNWFNQSIHTDSTLIAVIAVHATPATPKCHRSLTGRDESGGSAAQHRSLFLWALGNASSTDTLHTASHFRTNSLHSANDFVMEQSVVLCWRIDII